MPGEETVFGEYRSKWTVVVFLVLSLACQAPPPPLPRDLVDAAQVIREMMARRKLVTSGFFESYPKATPSNFVSFINSDLGGILWPPREDSIFADEIETEQTRNAGETVIPEGIAYTRNRPNPDIKRQIVYRADDESGEIVVEAYADPSAEPLFVRRWKLPAFPPRGAGGRGSDGTVDDLRS